MILLRLEPEDWENGFSQLVMNRFLSAIPREAFPVLRLYKACIFCFLNSIYDPEKTTLSRSCTTVLQSPTSLLPLLLETHLVTSWSIFSNHNLLIYYVHGLLVLFASMPLFKISFKKKEYLSNLVMDLISKCLKFWHQKGIQHIYRVECYCCARYYQTTQPSHLHASRQVDKCRLAHWNEHIWWYPWNVDLSHDPQILF